MEQITQKRPWNRGFLGRSHAPEVRARISATMKKRGIRPPLATGQDRGWAKTDAFRDAQRGRELQRQCWTPELREEARQLAIARHKAAAAAGCDCRICDPAAALARDAANKKKNRGRVKRLAVDYKGGECEDCGYARCLWAFDFHHVDPSQKEFEIARFRNGFTDAMRAELDKCALLCANCHRERHAKEYDQ